MNLLVSRLLRAALALTLTATLAACGLPRSGPSKEEIFDGSIRREGNAFIVAVNEHVTRASAQGSGLGFDSSFLNAGVTGSDTIQPGDVLGLTIYENVDDGLLTTEGLRNTTLEQVQVDGDGFIYVPYAGRIRAAGNTPEAIRRIIAGRLNEQTPDPQVVVRREGGDGSTVSVMGGVGAQGVYPIQRPTRTLSSMLARAGGVVIPTEIAQVTVVRDGRRGQIWLDQLYENPSYDIAIYGGDRIIVEEDQRGFTALGATMGQTRVPFETKTITAIEAIARVGGLNPALADPTGVFVMRTESAYTANRVLGRNDITGPQRFVYLLDLTAPTGLFEARDFEIRDGDTVYVTEAPYTRFQKIVGAITGTAQSANQLSRIGN